ncbi:hypothetical protein J7M28_00885 [bacterium]|nr:hypothetical protein [bacterium]
MSTKSEDQSASSAHQLEAQVHRGPVIRLARGKMAALFATIAALVTAMMLLSREATLLELGQSVLTAAFIFGWLGWAIAIVLNLFIHSSEKKIEAANCPETENESQGPDGEAQEETNDAAAAETEL